MSIVSAILFCAPPPVFHGSVRDFIAPEMTRKSRDPALKPKKINSVQVSQGEIQRARILVLIDKHGVVDVPMLCAAMGVGKTQIRKHLAKLADQLEEIKPPNRRGGMMTWRRLP